MYKKGWETRKKQASDWFRNLRDQLCQELEGLEPKARFEKKPWSRQKGTNGEEQGEDQGESQGGGEMALLAGEVIEKAGVHISTVYGEFSPEFQKQVRGAADDPRFWASGISVIVHPRNPHAPTAHMNTRMIVTTEGWFGGGGDLTPMLADARTSTHQDTVEFHTAYKAACERHDLSYYDRFKQQCDEYFYLPHRQETRGTGGIFYDHLQSGNWENDFAFTRDIGTAFLETYPKIIARRKDMPASEEDRQAQLKQRGRYVEFNLLYDRGTMFGLKTGGNIEAILSSMPPLVSWP